MKHKLTASTHDISERQYLNTSMTINLISVKLNPFKNSFIRLQIVYCLQSPLGELNCYILSGKLLIKSANGFNLKQGVKIETGNYLVFNIIPLRNI